MEVAEQLLVELETYLPDTCQVCMEEYTVERGSNPSVRCSGCQQGFHEPCLESLNLPSEQDIILHCPQCKPFFRVMTSKGGRTGRERPRASRRTPLASSQVAAAATAGVLTPPAGWFY